MNTTRTTRASVARARSPGAFGAFGDRNFRRLWPAYFFTYTSQWMQATLLTWLVLELTDSPWLVALVGFFGMMPTPVLGLFGGVLADRVNRQRLITATQAVNLAVALVITVLLSTGAMQFWHSYLVMLASGAAFALDFPSRRAIFLDLIGASGLTNAIALDSVGFNISRILGPTLAGVLIASYGVATGFVAVSSFYFAGFALLLSLRVPQTGRKLSGGANLARRLAEGFRHVRGSSTILATIFITIIMNLLLFTYLQMVPVIARDTLGVGPGLVGALMSAEGVGALVGAAVIASRPNIRYLGRVYVGGSLLALLALLLFSFSRWYYLSFPTLVILGLGVAGFGTMQSAIVMLLTPSEMRGRALGIITLAIGVGPIGALMVGAAASAWSPSFAIGLNAIVGTGLLALVWLLMPSLRQRIPPEERDVEPALLRTLQPEIKKRGNEATET